MSAGVLFDLDGTLLDTSEDLRAVVNLFAQERQRPPVSQAAFKPIISLGLAAMLKDFFDILPDSPDFLDSHRHLSSLYSKNICVHTDFFPEMDPFLNALDVASIPWGIVTNKHEHHTFPLVKAIGLDKRTSVIVCGDTLDEAKPHPKPILHACAQLGITPEDSFYIGDALTDIQAGRAAGMQTIAASYGFIPPDVDAHDWQADHVIQSAGELSNIVLSQSP